MDDLRHANDNRRAPWPEAPAMTALVKSFETMDAATFGYVWRMALILAERDTPHR